MSETKTRQAPLMRFVTRILTPLFTAFALAFAGQALAQDSADDTSETGDGLSLGQPAEIQIGQTYIEEEFGDWQTRCVRTETGDDPCQLYQLLQDQDGNSVAEISMFPVNDGGPAAAGATIITPLETLLTEQLRLSVDGSDERIYPFTFCSQIGCFSRVGFTAEEVDAFRAGTASQLRIVPAAAPDQTVDLTISLRGFTAGFEAISNN